MLRSKKSRKILLQRNSNYFIKWFYITVEIQLWLQYEPENLDVNKVCFVK